VCTDYEDDHGRAGQTHGPPAFLAFDDTFGTADVEWIPGNEPGSHGADLVICEVPPALIFIPNQLHDRRYILDRTEVYVHCWRSVPAGRGAAGIKESG
jgi:hypothetical protein